MATLAFLTALTTAPVGQVSFLPTRCLRRRLSGYACSRCSDCCPTGAIQIHDNRVHFDSDACAGCMQCSVSCPNDAFEPDGPALETELQSLPPSEETVISCKRQGRVYGETYVIPCVGALSIEHLLALGMKRSGKIIVNISSCSSCENRPAAEHFRNLLSILQNSGKDTIKAEFIIVTEPESRFPIVSENRRSFLTSLQNTLVSAVASQLPSANGRSGDGAGANRRVPRKVRLVREMLETLEQEQAATVSTLCLYDIRVSSACTGCPLCKGICPTGAIRIGTSDEAKSLIIDNTLCSGCGLCAEFCRHGAIALHKSENSDIRVWIGRDAKQLACPDGL